MGARLDAVRRLATIADVLGLAHVEPPRSERALIRCPLPGHHESTPSFSVQASGAGYRCFGCNARGGVIKLTIALGLATNGRAAVDFLGEYYRIAPNADTPHGRAPKTARTMRSRALARDHAARPVQSAPADPDDALRVRERLLGSVPMAGSPGEAYLRRRGLADIGPEHDVKYHPRFFGRPAVLFAVRDEGGAVVAVHGRMIDAGAPKALTIGPKRFGVYATSRDALRDALALAVTEAPIDALSIAAVGIPAIALLGTTFPAWLRRRVLGKSVLLATDDDDAGEKAAVALRAALDPFGAHCVRVHFGADKDANAFLLAHGEERLIEHLLAADTPA